VMNPYLVTGLEATPNAPLCPHRYAGHDALYVPVDDTDKEFHRFQDTMAAVGRLTSRGRLAVVAGRQGCGKTSLIHRCAAWLRAELRNAELTGEIFDLTDSSAPNRSIMLRMEQVITDLVDHLRDERSGVKAAHIEVLERKLREIEEIEDTADREERHLGKVDRVYRNLHEALPADRILIILLPPSSDIVDEIGKYAGFARHPRIVFFAETDHVEDLDRRWERFSANEAAALVQLDVGSLKDGDSWAYAQARQGTEQDEADFPLADEETMRRVRRNGVTSIGQLHRLLYGVYEDFRATCSANGSSPPSRLRWHHITDYHFRLSHSGPGGAS